MSARAKTPACSRSLFVKSLVVLAVEMMRSWMSRGKLACHMAGGFPGAKSTPPMPGLWHRWSQSQKDSQAQSLQNE